MKKQILQSTLPALCAAVAACLAASGLLLALGAGAWVALPAACAAALAVGVPLSLRAAGRAAEQAEREREALRRERDCLSEALGCLSEGVLLLDGAGRAGFVNTAACTALCADRRALAQSFFSGVPAAATLRPYAESALEHGTAGSVDLPLPDGRTARASVFPLPDGEGARGALVLLLDVTAEREAAAVRREFFASADEILRTPARNIKGFAELLASDMPLGGNKQEEISKRMLREAAQLNHLLGKLIVLSRMENGDLCFSRAPMDLAGAVGVCCDKALERAGQAGVTLRRALEPCTLCASAWEMNELTCDLLDNALRYNRAGGSVDVRLAVEHGAPCLRVTNTGEPIPPEHARRIFERFYRIDRGRGKGAGGAGLGLAIVRHIAESYGAVVTVTPQPDGNTFTVRFPAPERA